MIRPVDIKLPMVQAAYEQANSLGLLNNSITHGGGNIAGFLGEEMIKSLYPEAVQTNTYDFDLVLSGKTADVKTKRTTVCPKPWYECSVAAYNTRQNTDLYIFCRVRNDYKEGWALGFLPKEEYFSKSTFLKAGEVDPSNNFVVKADCYNVSIQNLYDVTLIPEYL